MTQLGRRLSRTVATAAACLAVVGAVSTVGVESARAEAIPPFIPADAPWLTVVNYYRAMAGLGPVSEDPALSGGAANHSCYMLFNGISHDEVPGRPGYTDSGDIAGNNGNVAVSSVVGTSARSHIELWMTGPFHAIGILRPNLARVGYGQCDNADTSPWRSGATLDVLNGLTSGPRPAEPILWPGNGTTTSLTKFITESPNPLDYCGWTGGAGLPVMALMPEPVSSISVAMSGPSGPLETCGLYSGNTSGTARALLGGDNAVVVMPRGPLEPGAYTTTVTTQARSVTWTFTVDPAAADGVQPVPTATAIGPISGYTPVTPFRFIDSRIDFGATSLTANVPKRVSVAGSAGIPPDATAISANFTIADASAPSYLTVYNCSASAPTASTLNFGVGEAVPNGAIIPLDGLGDLCLLSPVGAEIIVDITGYFRSSTGSRYTSITPNRVVDTRVGFGAATLPADGVIELDVRPGLGNPNGVQAVAMNVTAVQPAVDGYVTVWPCGIPRPTVSTVNQRGGAVKANIAIVDVPADGRLCFYSSSSTDLLIDLIGYFSASGHRITPLSVTRFTDTRDLFRPSMNAGTGGARVAAGQTLVIPMAGIRGVPSSARAVSINVTAADGLAAGYLTVWPCGTMPTASTVNFVPGVAVANGAQSKLSANGELCVFASAPVHVVVDITGVWS